MERIANVMGLLVIRGVDDGVRALMTFNQVPAPDITSPHLTGPTTCRKQKTRARHVPLKFRVAQSAAAGELTASRAAIRPVVSVTAVAGEQWTRRGAKKDGAGGGRWWRSRTCRASRGFGAHLARRVRL